MPSLWVESNFETSETGYAACVVDLIMFFFNNNLRNGGDALGGVLVVLCAGRKEEKAFTRAEGKTLP